MVRFEMVLKDFLHSLLISTFLSVSYVIFYFTYRLFNVDVKLKRCTFCILCLPSSLSILLKELKGNKRALKFNKFANFFVFFVKNFQARLRSSSETFFEQKQVSFVFFFILLVIWMLMVRKKISRNLSLKEVGEVGWNEKKKKWKKEKKCDEKKKVVFEGMRKEQRRKKLKKQREGKIKKILSLCFGGGWAIFFAVADSLSLSHSSSLKKRKSDQDFFLFFYKLRLLRVFFSREILLLCCSPCSPITLQLPLVKFS
jgi:hypothetical protein